MTERPCAGDMLHGFGQNLSNFIGERRQQSFTDGSLPATTRIETPWEVWTSIARGEIRGDVALFKVCIRLPVIFFDDELG